MMGVLSRFPTFSGWPKQSTTKDYSKIRVSVFYRVAMAKHYKRLHQDPLSCFLVLVVGGHDKAQQTVTPRLRHRGFPLPAEYTLHNNPPSRASPLPAESTLHNNPPSLNSHQLLPLINIIYMFIIIFMNLPSSQTLPKLSTIQTTLNFPTKPRAFLVVAHGELYTVIVLRPLPVLPQ